MKAVEQDGKRESIMEVEDKWFYGKMKGVLGVKPPCVEVARTFALESMWGEKPLGFHRVKRKEDIR
jgi:hypothetical protein